MSSKKFNPVKKNVSWKIRKSISYGCGTCWAVVRDGKEISFHDTKQNAESEKKYQIRMDAHTKK
jgi:hypothetical protein